MSYADLVIARSPALYWRLGAGGNADLSANGRDGTRVGGITVGGAAAMIAGDANAATSFDGVDDRLTSAYNPFSNAGAQTFAGWASITDVVAGRTIFSSDAGSNNPVLRVALGTSDVVFVPDNAAAGVTWSGAWPGIAQVVHWALVVDRVGATAELYVNGISRGAQAIGAYNAAPGNFELGARGAGLTPFYGTMAEVAIWARALSAGDVRALYLGNPASPIPGHYRPSRG